MHPLQGVLELGSPGGQTAQRSWRVDPGCGGRGVKGTSSRGARRRRPGRGPSVPVSRQGVEEVERHGAVDACLAQYVSLHRDMNVSERVAGGEHASPQGEAPENLPGGLEIEHPLSTPPGR